MLTLHSIVADKAPTGLVLFAYSIPSILTRIIVPLVRFPDSSNFPIASLFRSSRSGDAIDNSTSLTKEINYPLRLIVCAASSAIGLQLLAHSSNIGVLILGIMLAALSSNLGDMYVSDDTTVGVQNDNDFFFLCAQVSSNAVCPVSE